MSFTGKTAGLGILLFTLIFLPLVNADPLQGEYAAPGKEAHAPEPVPGESPIAAVIPIPDEDGFYDYGDDFFFEADDLVFEVSPITELRTFRSLFPNLTVSQRIRAVGEIGLRYSFEKDGSPTLVPDSNSGIDLLSIVMAKKPSHVIEALVVVPYKNRELDLLDVYNALGRIKNIQDHKYSASGRDVVIFKETTRLKSAKERKPIPDPAPTNMLPYAETIYLRFLDPYIGDLYLRGDVTISLYGINYSMTNFRDVSYSIFRVMKADRFSAIIYVEPVKEGILIYSMSGLYLPNFIAKRLNLTPNMNRRITVLLNWIIEGLRLQEDARQDKHFYRLKPKK